VYKKINFPERGRGDEEGKEEEDRKTEKKGNEEV
jgi:hypothetical protein